MSKNTGSCLCGKLTYEIEGSPLNEVCTTTPHLSPPPTLLHPLKCPPRPPTDQSRRSATATNAKNNSRPIYTINIVISNDFFKSSGKTKSYSTKVEFSRVVTFVFGPECGSLLWREGDIAPNAKVVRARTIDEKSVREDVVLLAEVYTENRAERLKEQHDTKQFPKMF